MILFVRFALNTFATVYLRVLIHLLYRLLKSIVVSNQTRWFEAELSVNVLGHLTVTLRPPYWLVLFLVCLSLQEILQMERAEVGLPIELVVEILLSLLHLVSSYSKLGG